MAEHCTPDRIESGSRLVTVGSKNGDHFTNFAGRLTDSMLGKSAKERKRTPLKKCEKQP
jgi:hypothetical protein